MKKLHLKFLAEFPEIKISAEIFLKRRPGHVCLCNFFYQTTYVYAAKIKTLHLNVNAYRILKCVALQIRIVS